MIYSMAKLLHLSICILAIYKKSMSFNLPNEHIVWDVIQMTSVLQPRTGRAYVVCGAFSFNLYKNGHVKQILSVPFVEGAEQLEALTRLVHLHLDTASFLWWRLVCVLSGIESFSW